MLYDANTVTLPITLSDGSVAHTMSSEICLARSQSCARMASISATDGAGPMPAAVVQQAVTVSGEMRAKLYAVWSTGTRLMRSPTARCTFGNRPRMENLADMTVGARCTICRQNSGGYS